MDLSQLIDIFLHLDRVFGDVVRQYGSWTYLILVLIIFCETGLVVTPFLPGDSLLFVAGTFAALGALDPGIIFLLLGTAAVAGNMVNYQVGHYLGPKVFQREGSRILKKEYLERTQHYYEKYGGMTIIIARFIPIIRTFAPFLAGIGRMRYARFTAYNVIGSAAWIASFVYGGYFFGNIPVVKRNFTLVVLGIIVVSVLPTVVAAIKHRRAARP